MIEIFKKIKAKCVICGTPLNGEEIDKIGDYYYCRSDYEKEMEKPENERVRKEDEFVKRFLKSLE